MSYERSPNSLLVPEAPETLDGDLFDEYTSIPEAPEVYERLSMPEDVFDHCLEAARNGQDPGSVTGVEQSVYDPRRYEELQNLKSNIKAQRKRLALDGKEESIEFRILENYRITVNERMAEEEMVRTRWSNPWAFSRYNEFVYGKPDADVFGAVVQEFKSFANGLLHHDSEVVRDKAQAALNHLPDIEGGPGLLSPDPEVFERVKREHYGRLGFYPLLLAGVELPETDKISDEVGEPALQVGLSNVGASHYGRGYQNGGWSANHLDEKIMGPEKYSWIRRRFVGLVLGHEVGSHVTERINGLRSSLRLLSIGMDRFVLGSEGRALVREQVPYDSFEEFSKILRWNDVLRRHLATSLMAGLAGDDASRLENMYDTINSIDELWAVSRKPDDDVAAIAKSAERRTKALLRRVWGRGIYKDMTYLEGNIAAWKHPERIADGDLGKYDPNNPRHRELLSEIGVL
jgi:hypothetical protein